MLKFISAFIQIFFLFLADEWKLPREMCSALAIIVMMRARRRQTKCGWEKNELKNELILKGKHFQSIMDDDWRQKKGKWIELKSSCFFCHCYGLSCCYCKCSISDLFFSADSERFNLIDRIHSNRVMSWGDIVWSMRFTSIYSISTFPHQLYPIHSCN